MSYSRPLPFSRQMSSLYASPHTPADALPCHVQPSEIEGTDAYTADLELV